VTRSRQTHGSDGRKASANRASRALRRRTVGSFRGAKWGVALCGMVCIYNLPQLISGSVQFDGLDVHYSAQRYLSDELHAGRIPFWTPYIFSGFPFLADLQVGAWYPLNWPFFAAGITPRSIGLELLLHDLIACGGAYALANRLIGRPAPAVAAAGGKVTGHSLLAALPGFVLFALNLFGKETAVNNRLQGAFNLSYHVPIPAWAMWLLLAVPVAILLLYFLKPSFFHETRRVRIQLRTRKRPEVSDVLINALLQLV